MAKVFKPVKPKKTDSYAKHVKYAEDLVKWEDAKQQKAKQEAVKAEIRSGNISGAIKIANGKTAKAGSGNAGKKRKSISL